jgi:hypothetical protein
LNVASAQIGDVGPFNDSLSEMERQGKIKVIDWASKVDTRPDGNGTQDTAGLLADGIHPSTDGYNTYTDLVVSTVSGGITSDPNASNSCGGVVDSTEGNSSFVETVKKYAWPEWRGRNNSEQKPEYTAAIERAKSEGQYIGGNNGNDCGGFVTRVMIDSGYEPSYNSAGKGGATPSQLDWVRANWTEIGTVESSAELQPGDVAFHVNANGADAGHTFLWVGEDAGFQYGAVEAAFGPNRAPGATITSIGPTTYDGSQVIWFRK